MSGNITRARTYTLGGLIKEGVDKGLGEVHTMIPGRIVRYDEVLQQADVLPLVQVTYYGEDGSPTTQSLPVVTCVPVMFPGAGGFRITFPVKAGKDDGDTCALFFAESSLDAWLSSGANDVNPLDERRFHLSDGVAVLGLRDFGHALKSAPIDRMTVGKDDGLQLHIDGTSIRIGDNEAPNLDTAGLGGATATALGNIVTWLTSHTHAVAGAVASASTTPAPTIPNVESGSVYVKK